MNSHADQNEAFNEKMQSFKEALAVACIEIALITDEDNIYYLTGYYDYLHMDFGRPTILIVRQGDTVLITPAIDENTAIARARVDRVEAWNDGDGNEWRKYLPDFLKGKWHVGIELMQMPALVYSYIDSIVAVDWLNVTPILAKMRMIKSTSELQLARHAGEVANALMEGARGAIAEGVAEFEVALAAAEVATHKAAELLKAHYQDADMSPNMSFLQIMASGDQIIQTHRRATTKIMRHGEPVFLCFCGMTNFHRFKLGFDRTFWIGEIRDADQAEVYQVALDSQRAALAQLRPGVSAESVLAAYAEVIADAGYDYPFRCGRATGYSYVESPQLVSGDKTILQPGMVLAVDGSISTRKFRAQIGDSYIITEDGYEALTEHPKEIDQVIL